MNIHVDTGVRAVHGGIELYSPNEEIVGTLGVLAAQADGVVLGVTTIAVAPIGKRPKVALERRRVELEVAEAIDVGPRHADGTMNVAGFLSLVRIPRSVSVSELVPGLTSAQAPADAGDVAGATVVLSAAGETYYGRLRAYAACFYMRDPETGGTIRVEDALEIVPQPGEPFVRIGDAGAAVFLRDGRLLGVVVAVAGETVFAAPLKPVFERLRLRPLSDFEAVAHNRTVPQSGRLAAAARPALPWAGPAIQAHPAPPAVSAAYDLTAAFRQPAPLPDVSAIEGFTAFKAKFDNYLDAHPARELRRSYAAQWVRESMSRWLNARSNPTARAAAFAPLVIVDADAPNLEVLSALTELAPEFLTEDVMCGVVNLMADGVALLTDEDRAALWRLVGDFLANGRDITMAFQTVVLRAVTGLMIEPAAGHVTSELHAAIDAALMLPPGKPKDVLFRQLVDWDTDDAVLHASKFLLRQSADQPHHLRTLVAFNKDLFELILHSGSNIAEVFIRSLAAMEHLPPSKRRSLAGVQAELGLRRSDLRALESPTLDGQRTARDARAVAALRIRLAPKTEA